MDKVQLKIYQFLGINEVEKFIQLDRDGKSKNIGSSCKRVKSDKIRDESRRNAFSIDTEFMNGNVTAQEMLAHATKRSEEISQPCPHAFGRIGVNFKDIISIIITCPFFAPMSYGGMLALDGLIRLVFIGKDMAVWQGEAMNMSDQGFGLCGVNNAQTDLSAGTPNRAQHGWTIIGIRAPSTPFIGSPPRWPVWTNALLTFFPPHFGRVRHSRLPNQGQASLVVNVRRSVGSLAAASVWSSNSILARQPVRWWSRLSQSRAGVRLLGVA
jgi:hypothetical protein